MDDILATFSLMNSLIITYKLQQIVPFIQQSKLYKIQYCWSVKGGKMKLQISSYFSVSVFT